MCKKSEILPKWMTKFFYSEFPMFAYHLQDYKLPHEEEWDGKNPHLTKLQISEWSLDRRVKYSSIEPEEILICWWSNIYRSDTAFCYKIFSWWPGIQVHWMWMRIPVTYHVRGTIRQEWPLLFIELYFDNLHKIVVWKPKIWPISLSQSGAKRWKITRPWP